MVWYFRLLKNFPQFVVIFPGGLDGKAGTEVRFLGQEGPLEKEMAIHSSILAWKKPHGQRSLVGYSPWCRKVKHDCALLALCAICILLQNSYVLVPPALPPWSSSLRVT